MTTTKVIRALIRMDMITAAVNAPINAHAPRLVPKRGAACRRILSYIAGAMEAVMTDSPSLIMGQFLAWVAERARTREQAVEAWHSCPHISVWEDAVVDGLVRTENDGHRTIALTRHGREVLEKVRALAFEPFS